MYLMHSRGWKPSITLTVTTRPLCPFIAARTFVVFPDSGSLSNTLTSTTRRRRRRCFSVRPGSLSAASARARLSRSRSSSTLSTRWNVSVNSSEPCAAVKITCSAPDARRLLLFV